MDENKILGAFEAHMGSSQGDEPAGTPQPGSVQGELPSTNAKVEGVDAQAESTQESLQANTEQETPIETIEIDPDEPLFEQTFEDGGQKNTQKLSLKELQQGYLRQKDYTRKTQELARQRETLPQENAKFAQEISESYGKRLSELNAIVMKTVAADLQGVDFNKLASEDPFEYVRLSNRANQIKELLQTIQNEQKAEEAKRSEEDKKKAGVKWQQSLEILQREIPNFGADVVKRLIDAAKSYGFSDEEVSQWSDHRQIKMLYDILNKQTPEAKRPEIEKKVALVTKVLKPGQPTKSRTAIDEARSKLKKSGKAEDALPIFEAMLR